MSNSHTPNPNEVRIRQATGAAERKLAVDALNLRSVREHRKTVYSSETAGYSETDEA